MSTEQKCSRRGNCGGKGRERTGKGEQEKRKEKSGSSALAVLLNKHQEKNPKTEWEVEASVTGLDDRAEETSRNMLHVTRTRYLAL